MSEIRFAVPESLRETIELLQKEQRPCVVAGCTNVLPDLRAKRINPSMLINVDRLDELKGIEVKDDVVTVGSATTISELLASSSIRSHAGIVYQSALMFADPLIRNSATVGGNIANASPAADIALALLALDASLVVVSANGTREVLLSNFFLGPGKTILTKNELIKAIKFNSDIKYQRRFLKFGLRQSMAIAVANVAVMLDMQGDRVKEARVAFGAVGPKLFRNCDLESYLGNKRISDDLLKKIRAMASKGTSPISDIRASAAYRRHLAGVLCERAVKEALAG